MDGTLTVLIVGGYGTFGGRLAELLEGEPRLALIVAGRSLEKAREFCAARTAARARLEPAAFDRDGDVAARLKDLKPDILVDASGPFQAYGENAYLLAEACIALGTHYLDLADASAFVAGIGRLDAAARQAGVFVLSGVSSFPALTAGVVRMLARDMTRVDSIRGGIAPSPHAGIGVNVLRAIAGYAGQEIELRRGGITARAHALTETLRYTVAPPGRLPLRNTLFSLVDVPDLRALPPLRPEVRDVWMGAGPVPEILHRALIGLSWLVRLGLVRTLRPLAGLMDAVTRHARWGEDRGGMFVEVKGVDAGGQPAARSWHLLAEAQDGPYIPSMAAEAIIRRLLRGERITPGARAGTADVSLDDYAAVFSGRDIHTGVRDEGGQRAMPLYQRLLGSAWDTLPPQIREMHDVTGIATAEGTASVRRGRHPFARIACRLMGFPAAGEEIPVTVRFSVRDGTEKWTRSFAGKSFSSLQSAGRGRSARLLAERFGPLTFAMALVGEGPRLRLVLRRWSLLGVPLPLWLGVRADAYEAVEEGRFLFNVEISHPLAGLIVHYRGRLLRKS